jgi:hypothetical protein
MHKFSHSYLVIRITIDLVTLGDGISSQSNPQQPILKKSNQKLSHRASSFGKTIIRDPQASVTEHWYSKKKTIWKFEELLSGVTGPWSVVVESFSHSRHSHSPRSSLPDYHSREKFRTLLSRATNFLWKNIFSKCKQTERKIEKNKRRQAESFHDIKWKENNHRHEK